MASRRGCERKSEGKGTRATQRGVWRERATVEVDLEIENWQKSIPSVFGSDKEKLIPVLYSISSNLLR